MGEFRSIPTSIQTERSRFSSEQTRRSIIGEELIEEFKNSIQDKRKLQILLLCTDLKDKQRSKHIVDSAVALENTGHNVTVLTTNFAVNLYSENIKKIRIVECGRWIPTNINGYFSDILYFIRSLYSTLYMVYAFQNLQPKASVILCETNYLMVPLIKYLTNYKIIYFQYQFDLVSHRLPSSKITFKWSWFIDRCLRKSDQILVPNKVFYDIYLRCFQTKITPTICEPYLNVRQLKKEPVLPLTQVIEDVTDENLVFLVLAEYHPRSNLELALDAFHLLLHTSDHAAHSRLKLVVAGHAGRGRTAYVRRLATRVRRLHLDTQVLLHPRPSKQHKKALLSGCLALVSCQEHGLWDRYVLEAMALGRTVIGTNTGFTNEVLENGVTGYVIPATPDSFCAAMSEIIYNMGKSEFIGKMAHCVFIKKYSLEAYGSRLNKILCDLNVENESITNCTENDLQNRELFFG